MQRHNNSQPSPSLAEEPTIQKGSGWRSTLKYILIFVCIALLIRTFAYQPFTMAGPFMKPTLIEKDWIAVSKFAYGYTKYSIPKFLFPLTENILPKGRLLESLPKRGDVIFAEKHFKDKSSALIGRVIAFPGERVRIHSGALFINDLQIKSTPSKDYFDQDLGYHVTSLDETLPNGVQYSVINLSNKKPSNQGYQFIVPQGHYFVVPDVRQFSYYESEQELALNLIPFEKFVGRLEVVILNTKGLPVIGSGRFSDLSSLAIGKLRFLRKLNKVD